MGVFPRPRATTPPTRWYRRSARPGYGAAAVGSSSPKCIAAGRPCRDRQPCRIEERGARRWDLATPRVHRKGAPPLAACGLAPCPALRKMPRMSSEVDALRDLVFVDVQQAPNNVVNDPAFDGI
jgi:hypothetical protein